MSTGEEIRVRLDKWLWAARFYKTRSLAAEAVEKGKVEVNGERAKRAKLLQAGDSLLIRLGPYQHIVTVRAVSENADPPRLRRSSTKRASRDAKRGKPCRSR